jgi:hypothetical protein
VFYIFHAISQWRAKGVAAHVDLLFWQQGMWIYNAILNIVLQDDVTSNNQRVFPVSYRHPPGQLTLGRLAADDV